MPYLFNFSGSVHIYLNLSTLWLGWYGLLSPLDHTPPTRNPPPPTSLALVIS
jgi:hypothetical protein